MADEVELVGTCLCPTCGKMYWGNPETDQICMECWTADYQPQKGGLGIAGAGAIDYYAKPNTIRAMSRQEVLEYLDGCPKTRAIYRGVGHNSATPAGSGIAIPRSYQAYHINHNGWVDIGYHWVIDTAGQIYLCRNLVYRGAHANKGNTGSVGYCFVGNFSGSGGLPSAAQIVSAAFLCAAHRGTFRYGCDAEFGHRWLDTTGTSCPGTNVSLEMLRGWVCGDAVLPEEPEEEEEEMGLAITPLKMKAGDEPEYYTAWIDHSKGQSVSLDFSCPGGKAKFRFSGQRDNGHGMEAETVDLDGEFDCKRYNVGEHYGNTKAEGVTLKIECLEGKGTVKIGETNKV